MKEVPLGNKRTHMCYSYVIHRGQRLLLPRLPGVLLHAEKLTVMQEQSSESRGLSIVFPNLTISVAVHS